MSGLSGCGLDRLRETMAGYVERGDVPGIVMLVSRCGEVHVDAFGAMRIGGPPMRRDTIFRIASVTKPIVAMAAMILVEDGRLRLDDPVDGFLPELSNRKVMKDPEGWLDDTVPAERPILVRDLLTMRMGLGYLMEPGEFPIMKAAQERGILVGPPHPQRLPGPDEWMRRLGELPLMHQPGQAWQYDVASDVLGVLVSRAAGKTLGAFMTERIFDPLGMVDTGFSVPPERIDRLATSYAEGVYDEAAGGEWSLPPRFEMGSGGLVSTADDLHRFARTMLDGDGSILSRTTVEAMTKDQTTPEQRAGASIFLGPNKGWGLGMAVVIERGRGPAVSGRFGWDGGLGTSAWMDPKEDLTGILLTQKAWTSPVAPPVATDFWTSAYAALED